MAKMYENCVFCIFSCKYIEWGSAGKKNVKENGIKSDNNLIFALAIARENEKRWIDSRRNAPRENHSG